MSKPYGSIRVFYLAARGRLSRCACALLLLAGAIAGGARAAEAQATPPAQPTRVAASFFFSSVESVDLVNETFNADFYLGLKWNDPRLAKLPPEQVDASAVWQPRVEVVNSRNIVQPWEPYFEPGKPGEMNLLGRFHGTFAAPMDLHDFPFDHQILPIDIESSAFRTQEMVFAYPGKQHSERGWTAPLKVAELLGSSARLPEWKIEAIQVRELDSYYPFVDAHFSRYRIEILVSRRSGYYVWKVIAIEAMIVMLSWVVFLLDASEIGNRLSIAVTLLLATVAFSYVVSGITPRIPYLTLLDWFLLGCFVLIFLSALEAVVVYFVQRRGKGAAATARIDRWSLVAFPVLFALFNVLLWAPALA